MLQRSPRPNSGKQKGHVIREFIGILGLSLRGDGQTPFEKVAGPVITNAAPSRFRTWQCESILTSLVQKQLLKIVLPLLVLHSRPLASDCLGIAGTIDFLCQSRGQIYFCFVTFMDGSMFGNRILWQICHKLQSRQCSVTSENRMFIWRVTVCACDDVSVHYNWKVDRTRQPINSSVNWSVDHVIDIRINEFAVCYLILTRNSQTLRTVTRLSRGINGAVARVPIIYDCIISHFIAFHSITLYSMCRCMYMCTHTCCTESLSIAWFRRRKTNSFIPCLQIPEEKHFGIALRLLLTMWTIVDICKHVLLSWCWQFPLSSPQWHFDKDADNDSNKPIDGQSFYLDFSAEKSEKASGFIAEWLTWLITDETSWIDGFFIRDPNAPTWNAVSYKRAQVTE
jgi:hypothetical protein